MRHVVTQAITTKGAFETDNLVIAVRCDPRVREVVYELEFIRGLEALLR